MRSGSHRYRSVITLEAHGKRRGERTRYGIMAIGHTCSDYLSYAAPGGR